jgi:uncharacterized membrane protein YhfC
MISFTLFLTLFASGLLEIFIPIILGLWVGSKLGAKWSVFFIGAAMWIIAFVVRLPINNYAAGWVYENFYGATYIYLSIAIPSLTAGIFEEGARWLAFKFAIKDHKLENGIMYGAGHGGIESLLLVGFSVLATAVVTYFYPETLTTVQLNTIAATSEWVVLIGVWERLAAIAFHLGMSVLVLQSFRQKETYLVGVAIASHFFLNFTAIYASQWGVIASEAVTTVWGLVALWYVWITWKSYKAEIATAPVAQMPESPAPPNPV